MADATTRAPSKSGAGVPGPTSGAPATRALNAALAGTLAMRLAAWPVASNWTWGLDTFRHWPLPLGIALAALAAIGFIPPAGRRIERLLERLGRAWERAGLGADLALSGLAAILLFALRDPVRFTGDSSLRAGLIGLPAMSHEILALAYPLDKLVNFDLPRLLWRSGMSDADALQLAGALVGALFTLVGCRFLRAAGARGASLPAAALALFGGAVMIHFAGYDKFGPLLLGLALVGKGAVDLERTGRGSWTLAAGAAIAVVSHRSGYLILPAVAWALLRAYQSAGDARGRSQVLAAAAVVLAPLALLLPRTLATLASVDLVVHLPGGAGTRVREAVGAPPVLLRVAGGLNAISYLAPLWLSGACAAWMMRRAPPAANVPPAPRRHVQGGAAASKRSSDRGQGIRHLLTPTTALALAPFVLLLALIEPWAGWARDWDDATGAGTVVALATAGALVAAWQRLGAGATRAPTTTLALAVSIALWGVHASETIGLARVTTLLTARPAWSVTARTAAWDFTGVQALNHGQPDLAALSFRRAIETGGPNPRLIYQEGLAYVSAGRLDSARVAFQRSATLKPEVVDAWLGLARAALATRDTAGAIAALDSALARHPERLEIRSQADLLRGSRTPR